MRNVDDILKSLNKDKPQLMSNRTERLSQAEAMFNRYMPCKNNTAINTAWFGKIVENTMNKTANAFVLNGNIGDQVVPRWDFEDYLKESLVSHVGIRDICVLDYVHVNDVKNTHEYYNINNNFEERLMLILEILKNKEIGNAVPSDATDVSKRPKALIIRYPEFIWGRCSNNGYGERSINAIVSLVAFINSTEFKESNNIVIICGNKSELHEHFVSASSSLVSIDISYPNLEQRLNMLKYLNSASGIMIEDNNELRAIANATAGLNLNHIENVWKSSLKNSRIDKEKIKQYKREVMIKEYGDKIEIAEPDVEHNLDSYGGMDYIKGYLREGVIKPIIKGDVDIIPKGLLFMGSPGTGKSYLAKCLASESGVSFAELKISKFESMWVGETEKNLEKALLCVKSLSPCFLFIDEIEQVLQRGDKDSNATRGNIFQMMMNFMGDPDIRGKVILIGATNYPNKLDEALKRAGRFDIKLVFTPPAAIEDIKAIMNSQLNRMNYPIAFEDYCEDFVKVLVKLRGYSQAEIELVVTKAVSLAKREDVGYLTTTMLKKALGYIKKSQNKETEKMTRLAIEECNDLEFLPPHLISVYNGNDIFEDEEKEENDFCEP